MARDFRGVSEGAAGFVTVGAAEQIAEGTYVVIEGNGFSVLLPNLAGAFSAVENRCSHIGSPLNGGRMKRGRITCPLHGAVNYLRTGSSLAATLAPRGLRTFETRVEDGGVSVRVA
jgi:3-phenylpropionate/trans-cinnamate dioxygenase ferredoxin subunit